MKRNIESIGIHEAEEIKDIRNKIFSLPRTEMDVCIRKLRHYTENRSFKHNKPAYADAMFTIGEYLGRSNQLDEAAEIFEKMIRYGKTNKLNAVYITALSNHALCRAQQHNFLEAIDIWKELLGKRMDIEKRIHLLNNISVAYDRHGDQSAAFEYVYKAMEACEDHNQERLLISPLINLGTFYERDSKPEKALECWLRVLDLCDKYDEHRFVRTTSSNIALAYNSLGNKDKALEYAHISLEESRKYGVETDLANPYNNIGFILETAYEYDEALRYYKKARSLYEKSSARSEHANCIVNFASIYMQNKQYDKAFRSLDEALAVVDPDIGVPVIQRINGKYAMLYAAIGDYQKAYEYEKQCRIETSEEMARLKSLSIPRREADFYKNKIAKQAQKYVKQNRELKKSNKIIIRTTKELEAANQKLSESVETLNWMVSVISHDVRAPLANHRRMLEMMKSEEIDPGEHQEIIALMHRSCGNVYKLIDGILDGIRLQRKNISSDAKLNRMPLVPMLRSVEAIYSHIATQKAIELRIEAQDEDIEAVIDEDLFKIVVRNLLNNAIKYTHSHGWIRIELQKEKEKIRMSICDNGMGMDKRTIEDLVSGKASEKNRDKAKDGIGLGLSLCKDALARMNSHMEIVSEIGKGTTISMLFDA
jgi:signal transduction histidine kinase